MKTKPRQSPSARNSGRRFWTQRCIGISFILCSLLVAGCMVPVPQDTSPSGGDAGMEETRVALAIQATSLAMQIQSATQAAESGPDPTQPPPPTQAPPPTQPPAPTSPPAEPTAIPPTAAPPTAEGPAGGEYAEGSMERAPYDPGAGFGVPSMVADFEGSSGLFPAQNNGASRSWYSDGRYNIAFSSRGLYTWYWTEFDGGDFYAEVVAVNGDQCVAWDRTGMIVRGVRSSGFFGNTADVDFGYLMGITCGGNYMMAVTGGPGNMGWVCYIWDGGSSWDCDNSYYLPSEYIDTGPGAANRIGVMAQGGQISLYVNGNYVDGFNEWTFWGTTNWGAWSNPRGQFALFLGTGQKNNGAISFEEFNFWNDP